MFYFCQVIIATEPEGILQIIVKLCEVHSLLSFYMHCIVWKLKLVYQKKERASSCDFLIIKGKIHVQILLRERERELALCNVMKLNVDHFPLLEPNQAISSLKVYYQISSYCCCRWHRLWGTNTLATCILTCYINLSPTSLLPVLTLPFRAVLSNE